MISEQTNDSKNISLLALFVSMFAFISAFANFFYQTYGESHSYSIVNLTTNVTTTTYMPKSFIIAGTGIIIDGLTLSFLAGILAFIVAMVAFIAILRYSKIINISKVESTSEITPESSTEERIPSSPTEFPETDIDEFCKSVIAWKVSATKKEEIFQLFKDNPYYLMGYLTHITQQNINQTKSLQKKTIGLTAIALILAAGSMAIAMYGIGSEFFGGIISVSVAVILGMIGVIVLTR
ncbi:hypothetical protein [Methanoregula sp.]|uniref:hypothetical protein n=1 Tax=Methanoregula sp. TaxID=2052170 RepID=UPI00236EFF25|nr:hypothetical protein [Methanoregula sp.]MDD1686035.1 hypothetical protein [Methanoregula sp.]